MASEARDLNLRAWDGEEGLFEVRATLDSSLKKNTAFIKKIKTGINRESEKWLLDAVRGTSLEKYMNEVTAAACESFTRVSKQNDIVSAVELASALHLRFTRLFTPYVELYFVHFITGTAELNDRDVKDKLERTKNVLRLTMEFQLQGIFRTVQDMPREELPDYLKKLDKQGKCHVLVVIPMIKEVMSYEFHKGTTLSIISSFLKRYSGAFLDEESHALNDESKAILKKLFESYTAMAIKRAVALAGAVFRQESKSHTISMKTGRVVEGIVDEIEELKATLEKFTAYCETACPILSLDLPQLKEEDFEERSGTTITIHQNQEALWETIWETEENRTFYTDIPLLTEIVDGKFICEAPSSSEKGKTIQQLLEKLDAAHDAAEINSAVEHFWLNGLNNNASKNKIYQHFKSIQDVNQFKNVARFLKINQEWFGKCIEDIIERLDKNFRFQIHHDDFAAKEILIFSELVKFKMVPLYVLFHKLRTLILSIDINGNIDLLTLLFEGCGKVLQFDPEYAENTKEMISLLKKVKDERNFVHSDYQAVRVFLMSLKPQTSRAFYKKRELTTDEKFINQLIKRKLDAGSVKSVAQYLGKFDWRDQGVVSYIRGLFSQPEQINYVNIPYLAKVLENLCINVDRSLYVYVVDQVLEDLTLGLEVNDYRENRKRLAQARYLMELANLKMVSAEQVIKILYKVVTFGYAGGIPQREALNDLDQATDFFRVKMVTVMVRTLKLGKFQKKVDLVTFLRLFDYYIHTKVGPVPIETDDQVNYMLQDVNLGLKVSLVRAKTFQEAMANLQSAMAEQGLKRAEEEREQQNVESSEEEDDDDADEDADEDAEDDVDDDGDEDDDKNDEFIDNDYSTYEDRTLEDQMEEETHEESHVNEDRFQREIDNEMDTIVRESLQNTGRPMNNLAERLDVPQNVKFTQPTRTGFASFALVQKSKGGRKAEVKLMSIPQTTAIAQNVTQRAQKAAEEKARIKKIVLNSYANEET